ncbi:MAG: DUF427 domain-containing protein [Ornithinimicrobium sp.]
MTEPETKPQESVWDYPRPPDIVPSGETVQIFLADQRIAFSQRTLRVRETSHPPTYYVPIADFAPGALVPVGGTTYCEFKGVAKYFDVVAEPTAPDREVPVVVAPRAAWHYPKATGRFAALLVHVAVMPAALDRCVVDDEIVVPQEGSFYGGWITSRVRGPFKGGPGTLGW